MLTALETAKRPAQRRIDPFPTATRMELARESRALRAAHLGAGITMMHIPELEPHCGSWIVTRKATGEVIGEFFIRSCVEKFNPQTCLIETALQYLGRINKENK